MDEASCGERQKHQCMCYLSNICPFDFTAMCYVCVCAYLCVFMSAPVLSPYEHAEQKEVDHHMSMNKKM